MVKYRYALVINEILIAASKNSITASKNCDYTKSNKINNLENNEKFEFNKIKDENVYIRLKLNQGIELTFS